MRRAIHRTLMAAAAAAVVVVGGKLSGEPLVAQDRPAPSPADWVAAERVLAERTAAEAVPPPGTLQIGPVDQINTIEAATPAPPIAPAAAVDAAHDAVAGAPAAPSPAPDGKPTLVTIDADGITAADALKQLSQATGQSMNFVGPKAAATMDLHAKDKPLLDVLAEVFAKAGCAPVNQYGDNGITFQSAPPPLAIVRPTPLTMLVLRSVNFSTQLQVGQGNSGGNSSYNLSMTLITDPASGIGAAGYGVQIDRVTGPDGKTITSNSNTGSNTPQMRSPGLRAMEVQCGFNTAGQPKRASIYGQLRVYKAVEIVEIKMDDFATQDKSFGTADVIGKINGGAGEGQNATIQISLMGPLLSKFDQNALQQLLSGGAVSVYGDAQQLLPWGAQITNFGSDTVAITLSQRNVRRLGRRVAPVPVPAAADTGALDPASIVVRIPKSSKQIELPVELLDLTLPE